jgi:hypothetical protein
MEGSFVSYDYNADRIFSEVSSLAARGGKIVRLWGVRDNFTCTCGRPDCPTPGKHPHGGGGWPDRATDDESQIWSWLEDVEEHTRSNFGVRLGASSGVIDVEFDSPEAEQVLKRYGLHTIDTPTYSSGRGEHRIFQYSIGLPDAGVVKVEGLEVRIGGGDAASQSVIPPSWHKSGKQYQWLPGKSPDDCNPAVLPDAFMAAILDSSKRKGSGLVAQARETLGGDEAVKEGGRHAFLVGAASWLCARVGEYTTANLKMVATLLEGANAARCQPPKSQDEVVKIAKDQFLHYQQKQIERKSKRPFERYGLAWNHEDGCWEPGAWRLTIVESDPPEYKLHVPSPSNPRRSVAVLLDADEITRSRDVAVAILEATKSVDVLDPNPARWAKTWDGENLRNEDGGWRTIRGLKCKLFDDADREIPPIEANEAVNHAQILYQYLRFGFAKTEGGESESDRLPNHSGVPKWIQDKKGRWGLWLKWNEAVYAAWRKRGLQQPGQKITRPLKRLVLEEVGEKDFETDAKRFDGGSSRWFILRDHHLEALERLSGSI